MKQQKTTLSLGMVLSIACFVLFCKVAADLSVEVRKSVLKPTRKRKAEISWPRQDLSSGRRSSSQKSSDGNNTEGSFWASRYLRPPRAMPRRTMCLEPIRFPSDLEVVCCHSPCAFTLAKSQADLKLASKRFAPLSIHELFQFHGLGLLINLQEPGVLLDRITATGLESFRRKNHRGVQKQFSPMLSYVSVQITHRMGLWLEHYWHHIGTIFSTHVVTFNMDSQTDQMLFSPFIYQLLLQKPTLKQWFKLEDVFILFLVYWKIQFLYHNRELSEINEFQTSEILEKKAKALIWMSEVLSHMFVPEFLASIESEKMQLIERKKDIDSYKPRCDRRQRAPEKLFEYLAGITVQMVSTSQHKNTSDDVLRKRQIFSELLKLWQEDCHAGYPIQAKTKTHQDATVPLRPGQKRGEDVNGPLWDNWCSATIDIILQSERFARELKFPSPAFKRMNMIRVGQRLYGAELDEEARQRLIDFEDAALKQPDKDCANTIASILNLIPDLPINLPGEIHSAEVFDHFLRYDRFNSGTNSYFPDKIKRFFHLKRNLGDDQEFWDDLEAYKKTRARKAKTHQNKRTKNARVSNGN